MSRENTVHVLNPSMFKYVSFQEYEVRSKSYHGTLSEEYDDDDDEDRNDELVRWRRQTVAQAVQRKVQL